ncbi:MAG TPA: hypothetical protein G4O08_08055 [Anaerolineae bacterium]|nr:hypothetical protein [Anaerolineae bacterium]
MSKRPIIPKDPSLKPFLRSMGLELLIYAPIVTAYLFIVLRYAGVFLEGLFLQSPLLYTVVSAFAILAQGVLLDLLTSWLLRRFGLRS